MVSNSAMYAVAVSVLFASGQVGAVPVADSIADFNAARNDGIGVGGVMVVAGSATDAAQQLHIDGSGSGDWRYGFGNSGDGQSFSGGFPLLDTWNGSAWVGTNGPAIVSATTQAPNGSTINSDSLTYRRWTSNGAFAGETLTARLAVTLNSPASDGVTIILNVGNTLEDITAVLTPDTFGQEQVFEVDFTDMAGNWVLAAVDPQGIGPANASNFFNDGVSIQLTIVPAPASAGVLVLGGCVAIRRRRLG